MTARIVLDWPPEAIAARLKGEYPDDDLMRSSHETIYRWLYQDGTLCRHLRRRHKTRRRQTRYGSGRRFIPGRVSIDLSPSAVHTRERVGDWEGDTMEGGKAKGGLATYVERRSRYLLAAKLTDKKAATMTEQSIKSSLKTPRRLRHALTVDFVDPMRPGSGGRTRCSAKPYVVHFEVEFTR